MYQPNLIARVVWAVCRHQQASLSRVVSPYRLGGGSYVYLLIIAENPGITQIELSNRLAIDRATVSKMLAALERENLIRRLPHPDDRRSVKLEATRAGMETFDRMSTAVNNFRLKMTDGISPEDQETTLRTLQKILANIREPGDCESDFFEPSKE